MNYMNTFIAVAEDCPVHSGTVPVARAGKTSIASIQYELLSERPYHYTQEDILFETFVRHKELPASERGLPMREAFFAKPQA